MKLSKNENLPNLYSIGIYEYNQRQSIVLSIHFYILVFYIFFHF